MKIEVSAQDYKALEAIRKKHQSRVNMIFKVNPNKALEALAKSNDIMTIRVMTYIMSKSNIVNNEIIAKVNLSKINQFVNSVKSSDALKELLDMAIFNLAVKYNAIRVSPEIAKNITANRIVGHDYRKSIINRITK